MHLIASKQKIILSPKICWAGKLRPEIETNVRMFEQELFASKKYQGARGAPM